MGSKGLLCGFLSFLLFFFPLFSTTAKEGSPSLNLPENWEIGKGISHKNLTLFPVFLKGKKLDSDQFITLDEGIQGKKVVVTERGSRLLSVKEQEELSKLQKEREKLFKEFGYHVHPLYALQQQRQVQIRRPMRNNISPEGQRAWNRQSKNSFRINKKKLSEEQKKRLPEVKKLYQKILNRIGELTPSSSGRVNWLDIQNNSKKTLYIMAGEMVVGGKQDRIVGVDTLVRAGEKATLQVFCVESGRWVKKTHSFQTMNVMVHNKLRYIAQNCKSQSKVWEEVKKTNAQMKTSNSTNTYRRNYESREVIKNLTEYAKILEKALGDKNIVGILVAINGKLEGADIFSHPKIFERVRSKLVRSYSLEALGAASKAKKGVVVPGQKDVEAFLLDLHKASIKTEKKQGDHENFKMEGKSFMGFGVFGVNKKGEKKLLHLNCGRKE